MKQMKTFKGYISSRKLSDGNYVPQKIQNMTIRNVCERYNVKYELSAAEYIFNNSFIMLQNIIDRSLKKNDGIIFYSIFQLPEEYKKRNIYLDQIIKKKKQIIFSNEKLFIQSKIDLMLVNDYIYLSKEIKNCPTKELINQNI
jgi:sporadic carbohydrate cluster protein (TIGR04323 family)